MPGPSQEGPEESSTGRAPTYIIIISVYGIKIMGTAYFHHTDSESNSSENYRTSTPDEITQI